MRFRMGMTIGFAAGYYLGAKAGRERYVQLNRMIKKARGSDVYETAAGKAKEVVDLTVEAGKHFVEDHRPGASAGSTPSGSYDGGAPPFTEAG